MDYKNICFQIKDAVKKAADYIHSQHLNRSDLDIETKGRHNYVTAVDKEAERIIVEELEKVMPEAGFIAEEGTSSRREEVFNWIIDPLDGTTNFIHGAPPFAISVALAEEKEVVAGVVYEFGLKEYFYSWKGGGAWLNGEPIKVSKVESVKDSLVATGFPYTNYKYLDEFMDSITWFMKNSHGLRRLGSAATDIVYVACGRYDAFYEYGLNPWDIAAGVLILREAGGHTTDFRGGDNYLFEGDVVCTNGHIHTEFNDAVQTIMLQK